MSLAALLLGAACLFIIAYFTYGRFLTRLLHIRVDQPTPAHTQNDSVDFVPSNRWVVLGHHFASIAGAGPIIGPIIAVSFGWIPALLWILLGSIFFGAVHDFTALVASVRHEGKSIGVLIERYVGQSGKSLFLVFGVATLILVIAVFTDIVAKTFVRVPSAASASLGFMLLALGFGYAQRAKTLPFWLLTMLGVTLMYILVGAGSVFPLELSYLTWVLVLLVYIIIASVSPVWLILQPRDYLNAYLLYGLMLLGITGAIWANPTITLDYHIVFYHETLGWLFPTLFVTVACGAISGFHSLVASGTTSKQLENEADARFVAYGGMMIEALLAVLALCSVLILSRSVYSVNLTKDGPVSLFASGLGTFIATLGIPEDLAVSFVALSVSAFALTSLDTCTRLARFCLQELSTSFPERSFVRGFLHRRMYSTLTVVALGVLLLASGGFTHLWPIFGSANQLLGAVALMAVTVWLNHQGIASWITLFPMVGMFSVTLSSLLLFAVQQFRVGQWVLLVVSICLILLSLMLLYQSGSRLLPRTRSSQHHASNAS